MQGLRDHWVKGFEGRREKDFGGCLGTGFEDCPGRDPVDCLVMGLGGCLAKDFAECLVQTPGALRELVFVLDPEDHSHSLSAVVPKCSEEDHHRWTVPG